MDTRDKRTFYLIGGIAWAVLSILFSVITESFYRATNPRWFLECWFAMFPVAWTIALLWAQNRERLRIAFSQKCIGPLFMGMNLLIQSTNQLTNGTHHSAPRYLLAGFTALAGVALCFGAVAIAVAEKKKTAPSTP